MLGVVTDCVTSSHRNPLWNWTILLHLLGKLCLDTEGLVSWHFRARRDETSNRKWWTMLNPKGPTTFLIQNMFSLDRGLNWGPYDPEAEEKNIWKWQKSIPSSLGVHAAPKNWSKYTAFNHRLLKGLQTKLAFKMSWIWKQFENQSGHPNVWQNIFWFSYFLVNGHLEIGYLLYL